MNSSDVVIVGGGIGGLANAFALTRAGHRVRVLEQATEFGEVGAGLQMAYNATRVLREWGLLDEAIARGFTPRRLVIRDAVDGSELTHLDLSETGRRLGAPYLVIHRSDLHAVLLQACRDVGVDLRTDTAVTDVSTTADSAVARSAQEDHEGRVLLAADGLMSRIRVRLSDDDPVNSGYVAYRGTMPMADTAALGPVARDDVVVYIGPRCHLVQYPLRGGELFNQVAVFESPTAFSGRPDWGGVDELDTAFDGMCEQVHAGLPMLWRDRRWPMFDRVPIDNWVDGRILLTGDAAHPMLQYLAQGACQALEDAHVLSGLVTASSQRVDWDSALSRFTAVRTERTAEVQTKARFWGELWHCDGMARTMRNAYLRERDPADQRHIDWLYGPTRLEAAVG